MKHIILSFLFFNIILLIFYNKYRKGHYYINKTNLFFYTILLIAFGTYGTGEGDYFSYKLAVEMMDSIIDVISYDGMEIQYNYLAYYVNGNYTLWRLVLFSVQFIGMSWLLYKAKLNTYPFFLTFVAVCLVLFTYQRSYWGVIYYFLGLYLLLEKKNPLFLIVIGLCYFSHLQNVILLALLPLGFINFKSWQLVLTVLLIGTISAVFSDFFTSFMDSGGIEGADYLNSKVVAYGEGHTSFFGSSIGEAIQFMFRYVPITIIVIAWVRMILTNRSKYLSLEKPFRGVMNVTISLMIASIVFLSASSLGMGIFFYRTLSMSLFSLVLLLPYLVEREILRKDMFNIIIFVYVLGTELSYVKDLYYNAF